MKWRGTEYKINPVIDSLVGENEFSNRKARILYGPSIITEGTTGH